MNCSMPGLPVHHQLLEFTQTHVHWVGDAIQPSHPLSSPSPPAPKSLPASESFSNESALPMRCGQSTGVSALASFLPKNSQGWSPLEWTGWISLQLKRLSVGYNPRDCKESDPTEQLTHTRRNLHFSFARLSHSVVSNCLWSHGLWPTRFLCPWDFPGKNTGVVWSPTLQADSLSFC